MRISKMGMKNVKLSNLDEMYPAQDILFQTNQVKQYGSGVYAYDNIPLKVQDNIEEVIKKCFNKADCIEVQMPLLQQEEMWKRSGRYDNYIEEGVMMTSKTDKGNYCLAPTAEEAITTFVENRVTSHKQLPAVFYQIGPKFRNEIRNRGYLLRGKEFLMFDLYSFDKDEEGMMQTYKKIRDTYFEVFRKLQLDIVAVAADNGSMGGKNSEEIMALSRIGEDTILFDEDTKQGLNVEVLEKENAEQYLKEVYNINDIRKLHERKAVELGHIFALGTKYSDTLASLPTSTLMPSSRPDSWMETFRSPQPPRLAQTMGTMRLSSTGPGTPTPTPSTCSAVMPFSCILSFTALARFPRMCSPALEVSVGTSHFSSRAPAVVNRPILAVVPPRSMPNAYSFIFIYPFFAAVRPPVFSSLSL